MKRNILVVTGDQIRYFEASILRELHNLEGIALFVVKMGNGLMIPEPNLFLKAIDKRIPQFSINPSTAFEHIESLNKINWIQPEDLQETDYQLIIDLTQQKEKEFYSAFNTTIIRPALYFKDWDLCSLRNKTHTTIALEYFHPEFGWESIKTLSFKTEKGIYNNRSKALYYFAYLITSLENAQNYPSRYQNQLSPTWLDYLLQYLSWGIGIVNRKFRSKRSRWHLALLEKHHVHLLPQPKDVFRADPFAVADSGKFWIFFEEMLPDSPKGYIAAIEVSQNRILSHQKVLETDFHLSFPNVFFHEGNWLMLPEHSASGQLAIYQSDNFPFNWTKKHILLFGIKALDPVLFYHQNKWWVFFNKIEAAEYGNNERLYIYYSDDLFGGKWQAHRKNPVLIDAQKARNAGKIYKEKDYWVRPSQNCLTTYGSEIYINKIIELSTENYIEVTLRTMNDLNAHEGMHTINHDGDFWVTDFYKRN